MEDKIKPLHIWEQLGIDAKTYDNCHYYIKKVYGSAKQCEKCGKKGTKIKKWNIHWALIRGRVYSKNRDDYMQLCASCHSKYDYGNPRLCAYEDCKELYYSKGFCPNHYSKEKYRLNRAEILAKQKIYKHARREKLKKEIK